MTPYNALQVAQYVVTKCTRDKKWINSLTLQCIMYYIQEEYALHGKRAFDSWIQVIHNTAQIPIVSEYFGMYAGNKILTVYDWDGPFSTNPISLEDRIVFDIIIENKREESLSHFATSVASKDVSSNGFVIWK